MKNLYCKIQYDWEYIAFTTNDWNFVYDNENLFYVKLHVLLSAL